MELYNIDQIIYLITVFYNALNTASYIKPDSYQTLIDFIKNSRVLSALCKFSHWSILYNRQCLVDVYMYRGACFNFARRG